jgi:LmbE family N-acetylglucosaminyl deacetylase
MQTNIIAPHLDDAVLSCWHQIDKLNSQTITLFAGSPETNKFSLWDRLCGQNNSRDAMAARILENAAALASTDTVPVNFGYLDRSYIKSKRNIPQMADCVEASAKNDARFFVAAGIGKYFRRHPDHITTRKVGNELIRRGREVMFYADLPYSLPFSNFENWPNHINKTKLQHLLGQTVEILPVELDKELQSRKQEAVYKYVSQFRMVNHLALGALKRPAAYKWEVLFKAQQ